VGDTVGDLAMDMAMAEGPTVTTITGTVTTMEIADTTMIAMAGAFKFKLRVPGIFVPSMIHLSYGPCWPAASPKKFAARAYAC